MATCWPIFLWVGPLLAEPVVLSSSKSRLVDLAACSRRFLCCVASGLAHPLCCSSVQSHLIAKAHLLLVHLSDRGQQRLPALPSSLFVALSMLFRVSLVPIKHIEVVVKGRLGRLEVIEAVHLLVNQCFEVY